MDDLIVNLGPGSIVVVGPNGRLTLKCIDGEVKAVKVVRCNFIGYDMATAAHKAIVDEVWAKRNEYGDLTPDD